MIIRKIILMMMAIMVCDCLLPYVVYCFSNAVEPEEKEISEI